MICLQEPGALFTLPHELVHDYEVYHFEGASTALLVHSDLNSRVKWWSGSTPEFCFARASALVIDGVGFVSGYLCDSSYSLAEYVDSVRQLSCLLQHMSHKMKVYHFVLGLDGNIQLPGSLGVRCGEFVLRDACAIHGTNTFSDFERAQEVLKLMSDYNLVCPQTFSFESHLGNNECSHTYTRVQWGAEAPFTDEQVTQIDPILVTENLVSSKYVPVILKHRRCWKKRLPRNH